jgi:predicted ATP-dependent Lon-type protease
MKFALSHNKYINSTDFDNKYIKTISNIINLDPNEEATVNIYSIEKNIKNFLSQNKNKEEEIDNVKKKIIFNGYDDIFLNKLNVKI